MMDVEGELLYHFMDKCFIHVLVLDNLVEFIVVLGIFKCHEGRFIGSEVDINEQCAFTECFLAWSKEVRLP
jgi:hypothetical protein